jgi:hypothetical protein
MWITEQTFYRWKKKHGGLGAGELAIGSGMGSPAFFMAFKLNQNACSA